MTLLDDWKDILTRAWSVRWWAASVVFTGLEAALPAVEGLLDMPRGIFAAVAGVTGAMGILARLMAQNKKEDGDEQA